jgi:hypothetical protein
MSLQKDAIELSKILNEIVASAAHCRSAYVAELANRIEPNVARYDRAVFDLHSREAARDALADLADSVSAVSAESARGEPTVFKGDLIDRYFRLYTIFRESKYRDQTL